MSDSLHNPTVKGLPDSTVKVPVRSVAVGADPTGIAAYQEQRGYDPKYYGPDIGTPVDTEAELAAALAAGDKHITLTSPITLTTKHIIPRGTTLRVPRGNCIDFAGGRDLLVFHGSLEAGDWQVFCNAVGHERAGTEQWLTGVPGSVWGDFGARPRRTIWWGAFPESGDVGAAIQAAIDSAELVQLGTAPQQYWVEATANGYEVQLVGWCESSQTISVGGARMVFIGEDTMSGINFTIPEGNEVMEACYNAIHHYRDFAFFVRVERVRFNDSVVAAGRANFRTNKMNEQSSLRTVYMSGFNKYGLRFDNPGVGGGFRLGIINQGYLEDFWIIGGRQADSVGVYIESVDLLTGGSTGRPFFAGGGFRISNGTIHHSGLANIQLYCHSGSWSVEHVNLEQTGNAADNFNILLGDAPGGDTDRGRWGVNYFIRNVQPSESSSSASAIRVTDTACSYRIENTALSPVAAEAGAGRRLLEDDALNATDEPNHVLTGDKGSISLWARQARNPAVLSGGYIRRSDGTTQTGVSPINVGGREIYWQADIATMT